MTGTITEQDLARLLEAKDAATEASEKAFSRAFRLANGSVTSERISADIAYERASKARMAAEDAYSRALGDFVASHAAAA